MSQQDTAPRPDLLLTIALAAAINARYAEVITFLNEQIKVLRELIDKKRLPLPLKSRSFSGPAFVMGSAPNSRPNPAYFAGLPHHPFSGLKIRPVHHMGQAPRTAPFSGSPAENGGRVMSLVPCGSAGGI